MQFARDQAAFGFDMLVDPARQLAAVGELQFGAHRTAFGVDRALQLADHAVEGRADGSGLQAGERRQRGVEMVGLQLVQRLHDLGEQDGFAECLLNRYCGTGWMKEPCSTCEFKEQDLGGYRCQAYMLANDPEAADPVCVKSPQHHLVQEAVARAASIAPARVMEHPLVFRDPANSRRLSV